MFLILTKKSPYYQLVYEIDGLRTTVSTRTKEKVEAEKFMSTFNPPAIEERQKQPKIKSIRLNFFVKEYSEYILSTKSKSYLRSVTLSFNQFLKFHK